MKSGLLFVVNKDAPVSCNVFVLSVIVKLFYVISCVVLGKLPPHGSASTRKVSVLVQGL